jgi:hypothetical protein
VSLDLVGTCDAGHADMFRLETLTKDIGTLVGGYRFAEANEVRDRRANIISQFYGGKWKENSVRGFTGVSIKRGKLAL